MAGSCNFPTSLDNFTDVTDGNVIDDDDVNDLQKGIEALEAKVGIDSSAVSSSHDYKINALEVITTQGDIVQGSAANAPERLGIGASGTVPVSDGTNLSYGYQAMAPDEIHGLHVTLDTDTDHDFNISIGSCRDSTNAVNMRLTTTITKQIDGAGWVVGDDNCGLEVAVAANTKYYFFLIQSAAGVVDAGWDTVSNAANLLTASSYTYYRLLAIAITDASANIENFFEYRNRNVSQLRTGSYTGDSNDDTDINIGIDLDSCDYVWLVVKPDLAVVAAQYFGHGNDTDESFSFSATAGVANYIQDLTSTGFQVGTALNGNGVTYHWVAHFVYGDN